MLYEKLLEMNRSILEQKETSIIKYSRQKLAAQKKVGMHVLITEFSRKLS
jgi:hypothetical protein